MTTLAPPPHGPLCAATLASLRTYFHEQGHRPSADQWDALADIATTLEAMADGTCAPRVFLSSLDPGVGKTSVVSHFVRALLSSPDHRDVGMVVCVARIAEAEVLATALSEYRSDIAVWTAKDAANETGGVPPEQADQARLLITTQQRIERATDGKRRFQDVVGFQYRGKVRQVRVWDEAWLPGLAIDLNEDAVAFLFQTIRRLSQDFRRAIGAFFQLLGEAHTGDLIDIPDWERLYGVTIYALLEALDRGVREGHKDYSQAIRDDQRDAATSLYALAGKAARVWRNNHDGSAVLSYRDTLPADLSPLLVLDASGRVRQTYAFMERHRGLVRLRGATKDYAPLTVHHWKRGGGKDSFGRRGGDLVAGIVSTINMKPAERWLVVVHKQGQKVGDLKKEIEKGLDVSTRANVSFVTWGSHVATNNFTDVPNVILAGTLFMRPSHYVALTHLVQNRPTAPGFVDADDVVKTTAGEHANLVLQAICRGRVRKSDGVRCLPMDAYVIAAPNCGIGESLPSIFPGCTVATWDPLGEACRDPVVQVEAFLRQSLAKGTTRFDYPTIQNAIGSSPRHFGRITCRPEWDAMLMTLGLVTFGGARRVRGVHLPDIMQDAA
jgi:hypothetical protein